MADLQISNLPALAEAGIQATDVLALADLSATETKKVTVKDLVAAAVALLDSGDIPAAKVATPFAANAVATATIQDLAVTAGKIANGTITATQIANATITATQIVDDTITATQIAANAITASELADDAVDTAAIANLAVNNAKIANTTISYGKLNLADGDIPGAKLTSASVTAAQLATNSVTATELADNAVDSNAIVNGAVTGTKIASNTIAAGNIVNNTITAAQIANGAIGANQIAAGAVDASKLSGALAATSIANDAVSTQKIQDDAVDSSKLAANAVDAAALADNAVDTGAVQNGAITNDKVETSTSATTGLDGATKVRDGSITAAKLNTSNIDRSLNVASGNLGINNTVTAATRSGITYNAQGLITGTVALAAADLPVATSSAVGGVSVGTGLTVNGSGALSLTNSVTGATVSGITFNAQGMITAATALVASDLPVATTSAKGAVQITSGGGLSVDGSGNLTTSTSGISAGTYQSITVNNKGVATAGAALTAALIPNLAASKITSGSFDAARIANDSIDGSKLSNTSTAIFQSIAQSGYPTAQFSGQILFDTVSEDAFIWDGNAWQAITTLTKGSLVFGGTYNAGTSQMVATTSAGIAAGLAVGSNLPTPSATTDGVYVVVASSGTPSSPAPAIAFAPPDYILGVTNSAGSSWNEVDLSQTVAGQVASNITFTPYGQLSATNLQDALQELETEKLALAGGTVTGQVLIGNTGSLVFEGSTVDAYETTLTVADPTTSDKTITLPNVTGTVITTGDTGTVNSTMIANDTIQNVDIKSDAAIAFSKLAALTSAQILVGNGSNVPTAVAVTGDIGINNAGLTSITAGAIVNADISNSAAITGSKVTTGTTSAVGVLQLTDSTSSTSTTTAATPNAVKSAYDLANTANTNAANAAQTTGTTFTGNVIIDNAKELRLSEADGDGAHFTSFKAQAQSADITYTLPATAPTTGQVLKSGSTATTLEWGSDTATDSTKMPLAGGTFTGDVTFTGDSSNGLWDKSASAFVANLTGNVTGTATTANSVQVDATTDANCFPMLTASGATGQKAVKSSSNLSFNSSTGALTATSFVGAGTLTDLTVSGDLTLDSATNAGKDIVWDESASTLKLRNVSANSESVKLIFGNASTQKLTLYQTSGNSGIVAQTGGSLHLQTMTAGDVRAESAGDIYLHDVRGQSYLKCIRGTGTGDNAVEIYHGNTSKKLETTSSGVTVSGDVTIAEKIIHSGDTDTALRFPAVDTFTIETGGAERTRFTSGGRVLIGSSVSEDFAYTGKLQITGSSPTDAAISVKISSNDALGSALVLAKSRGSSIVNDDDQIGAIAFCAHDGTDTVSRGAEILAQVDGTPGANSMPGRLVFKTNGSEQLRIDSAGRLLLGTMTEGEASADNLTIADSGNCGITIRSGSSNAGAIYFSDATTGADEYRGLISYNQPNDYFQLFTGSSERFRIGNLGQLGIGGATYGSSGQVLTSGGASAAPSWQDAGGGGGSITATASGAIVANKSCCINSDGTVSQIVQVTTPSSITGNSGVSNSTYNSNVHDIVWIDDTRAEIIINGPSDTYKAWRFTFEINANGTYNAMAGPNIIFGNWTQQYGPRMAKDSSTGYIGYISQDDRNNDIAWKVYVPTSSSGTGMTFVANGVSSNGSGNKGCSISSDNQGNFLLSYRQSNKHAHRTISPTASNNNTNNSNETTSTAFSPDNNEYSFASVYCPSVKAWLGVCVTGGNLRHFWANYAGHSSGDAPYVVSGSSTFISGGSQPQMTWDSTNEQVLITYLYGGKGYVRTITVSQNVGKFDTDGNVSNFSDPVANTAQLVENHSTNFIDHAFVKSNNQVAVLLGRQSTDKTHVNVYGISGTSITLNSGQPLYEYVWANEDYYHGAIDCLTSKARLVVAVKESNNSNGMAVKTIDIPQVTTNLTAENFVGFADAGYSNGATATISVVGSTTTQSSLTPGQKYFVQEDGTLGLTADSTSVEAGLALSSTSLLIK